MVSLSALNYTYLNVCLDKYSNECSTNRVGIPVILPMLMFKLDKFLINVFNDVSAIADVSVIQYIPD